MGGGTRWGRAEVVALLSALALVAAIALASVRPVPTGAQDDATDDAGAPPGDLPRSLVVEDAAFLFDRLVPLDPGAFQEVGAEDDLTL
jgi:hypothetical protein